MLNRRVEISFLLLVVYIVTLATFTPEPAFADSGDVLIPISVEVTNNAGANLNYVVLGSGINAKVSLQNKSERASDVTIILCVYKQSSNTVLAAQVSRGIIGAGNTEALNVNLPAIKLATASTGDYLKLYLYDGESQVLILAESSTLPAPEAVIAVQATPPPTTPPVTAPAILVSDFAGCNNMVALDNPSQGSNDFGVGWTRVDYNWGGVMPERGVFNENYLKNTLGSAILTAKKNDVTMLPILCYSVDWAALTEGYTYHDLLSNNFYEYSDVKSASDWKRTLTVYKDKTKKEIVAGPKEVNCSASREAFIRLDDKGNIIAGEDNLEQWKMYIEKVVSTFTAPPYNLKYFQVWNEAHTFDGYPSGYGPNVFYQGDMDVYINYIHKSAAEIIRKYGGKVVYGGWPAAGGINLQQFFNLLDKNDAWKTIDVYAIHYYNINDMEQMYSAAKARGVANPAVWQTEHGWTTWMGFIPDQYPRSLYWSLTKNPIDKDQFKLLYFTAWSPDHPDAYGYQRTLVLSDHFSDHGLAMRTFTSVLGGGDLSRFTSVSSSKVTGYSMHGDTMQGFKVGDNKAVISFSVNDPKTIQGSVVTFRNITGVTEIQLIDAYGRETKKLTQSISGDEFSVTIPHDYEQRSFYVVVNAAKIN